MLRRLGESVQTVRFEPLTRVGDLKNWQNTIKNSWMQHTPYDIEDFEWDPKNFLYFRARAITADIPNGNGDLFPLEELRKSYKTFIGKGFYLNHDSTDPSKATGIILDAVLVEDVPEGDHDYVECLVAVDRNIASNICQDIEAGNGWVSMGCLCNEAECSICHNIAHNEFELCAHMRPSSMSFVKAKQVNGQLAYEINRDVTFTELSKVQVPADNTAGVFEIFGAPKANWLDRLISHYNEYRRGRGEKMDNKVQEIVEQITPIIRKAISGSALSADEKTKKIEDLVESQIQGIVNRTIKDVIVEQIIKQLGPELKELKEKVRPEVTKEVKEHEEMVEKVSPGTKPVPVEKPEEEKPLKPEKPEKPEEPEKPEKPEEEKEAYLRIAQKYFESWDKERCKDMWNTLTESGTQKERFDKCLNKMKGKVDDEGAYCSALFMRVYGKHPREAQQEMKLNDDVELIEDFEGEVFESARQLDIGTGVIEPIPKGTKGIAKDVGGKFIIVQFGDGSITYIPKEKLKKVEKSAWLKKQKKSSLKRKSGEAEYYMKIVFSTKEEAAAVLSKLRDFFSEGIRSYDFWQANRNMEGDKKRDEFWIEFEKYFPQVSEYLKKIDLFGGDCNNALAGYLDFGNEGDVDNFKQKDNVITYSSVVWHMADWDGIKGFIKTKFGAQDVDWTSAEYGEPFEGQSSLKTEDKEPRVIPVKPEKEPEPEEVPEPAMKEISEPIKPEELEGPKEKALEEMALGDGYMLKPMAVEKKDLYELYDREDATGLYVEPVTEKLSDAELVLEYRTKLGLEPEREEETKTEEEEKQKPIKEARQMEKVFNIEYAQSDTFDNSYFVGMEKEGDKITDAKLVCASDIIPKAVQKRIEAAYAEGTEPGEIIDVEEALDQIKEECGDTFEGFTKWVKEKEEEEEEEEPGKEEEQLEEVEEEKEEVEEEKEEEKEEEEKEEVEEEKEESPLEEKQAKLKKKGQWAVNESEIPTPELPPKGKVFRSVKEDEVEAGKDEVKLPSDRGSRVKQYFGRLPSKTVGEPTLGLNLQSILLKRKYNQIKAELEETKKKLEEKKIEDRNKETAARISEIVNMLGVGEEARQRELVGMLASIPLESFPTVKAVVLEAKKAQKIEEPEEGRMPQSKLPVTQSTTLTEKMTEMWMQDTEKGQL